MLPGERSDKIEDPNAHGTLQGAQWSGRIPRSDDESSRETLLIMLPGDRSRKIEDSSAHGTLQRTQAPGRIPKSDEDSRCKILLTMLRGDRSRKIEDSSVYGTQKLIESLGTTLSLGHRTKGPTQCIIGTQDFSKDFGNNEFSHTGRIHKIDRRNLSDSHSEIFLQEHNFRRMNERINGNASDGEVELRQGNNIFVTLRTDQLSAVEERGFHPR